MNLYKNEIQIYFPDITTSLKLQFFEGLKAGFPSPAQDYIRQSIDLNFALLIDKENTRFIKIKDNGLSNKNIFKNDLAILDNTLPVSDCDNIYCCYEGDYFIKHVRKIKNARQIYLTTGNPKIPDIKVETPLQLHGVITYTITPHIPTHIYPNGVDENSIDLNKLLVKNPASTFLGFVEGNSMINANILNGELAIIDKSLPYENGYIAMCRIEDLFTIKYIKRDEEDSDTIWLLPANETFPPIKVTKDENVEIWGIITHTITPHTKRFAI